MTTSRLPGEAVQNVSLFIRAWGEFVELRTQPQDKWLGQALLALQALPRFEIAVASDSTIVGGMILGMNPWDAHVGPCCAVWTQYVLPEFRNIGISRYLMREAMRVAHSLDAPVLSYSHRVADWKYETIYRKVHANTQN